MYNNITLKKDNSGLVPVAQVYNQSADDFEVLKGENGAMRVSHQNQAGNELFTSDNPAIVDYPIKVKDSFSGDTDMNYTFPEIMKGLFVSNDVDLNNLGSYTNADVVITVNDLTFTIKPGETFDERLDDFATVSITSEVPFRVMGRA